MKRETPQMVLFDLDGTLLDPGREIRERNLAAIEALIERGVLVGFSSGRSPRSVAPFIELVRPNGPLVLLNGCVLWDPERAAPLHDRRLARRDAVAAVRAVVELGIHVNVYIGDALYVRHRGAVSLASEAKDGVPHVEVDDLVALVEEHPEEPFKLLCIDESAHFAPLLARLEDVVDPYCTIVNSEPSYLEILPPGVHKGCLLAEIEARYGVDPTDIVAFGDELNDVELLRAVGHAVVMGNGNHKLRRLVPDAHYIGTNDTDAIADFLVDRFDLA